MFLGMTFAGGLYSFDTTPLPEKEITKVKLSNGIVDELYITSKDIEYNTEIPTVWDFGTILYAKFSDNLLAGNIDFAVNEVDKLRLKRRKKGEVDWITLYERSVLTAEDLFIEWVDLTARSNTTYEYTIAPIFGDVEGSFFANEITTSFRGLFIMDRDKIFATDLDVQITEQRNKPRSVVTTVNRKYPFVVSNGLNDYDSGSVSAQFLEYNPNVDDWNIEGGRSFVSNLKDFLNGGSAKLLKYEDGRMWLIDVSSSSVTDTEDDMHLQIHTSFEWTEIGNCEDPSTLYDYNFIDEDLR